MNNIDCQYLDLVNPLFAIGLACLATMVFLGVDALAPRRSEKGVPRYIAINSYFGYSITALAACKLMVWLVFVPTPIFGWDAIDLWLPEAIQNLQWFESGQCPDKRPDNRHPQVTSLVFSGLRIFSETGIFYFNIIMLLTIAFVIPFQKELFAPRLAAASFAAFFFPFPLLETHVLVVGYSDFLLCIAFVLCLYTLGYIAEGGFEKKHLIAAGLSIFLLSMVKNAGFLLAIIAVFSAIYVRLAGNHLRLALISAIFAPLIIFSFLSMVAGIGWLGDGVVQITLGGWDRVIVSNSGLDVLKSELASLTVNQSFSVLLLAVIFIVSLELFAVGGRALSKTIVFLIVVFLLVEWALIGFQLFTAHGFHYAVPHNDTGGSRFKLPLMLLGAIIILETALNIKTHERDTNVMARLARRRCTETFSDD